MQKWLKWLKDLAGGGAPYPVAVALMLACAAEPAAVSPHVEGEYGTITGELTEWTPLYFGTPATSWAAPKAEFRFDAKQGGLFQLSVSADKPKSSIQLKLYKLSGSTWKYIKSAAAKSGSTFVTNTPSATGSYRAVVFTTPVDQGVTATLTCSKGTCSVGGSVGAWCGGRGMQPCAAGLFCNYKPGALCGAADAPGTCAQKAQFCPMVYLPVCGCDGKTYGNTCAASSAGVGVYATGACCTDKKFQAAPIGAAELAGWWSDVVDGKYATSYQFQASGTFSREDAVSPCPAGATCIWSGIVTSAGTWTIKGMAVQLKWTSAQGANFGLQFPTSLASTKQCTTWHLAESGTAGETFSKP